MSPSAARMPAAARAPFEPTAEGVERDRAHTHADAERDVLEALAKGLPMRDVLTRLVSGLERIDPGAACSVWLVDGHRLRLAAASGLPDGYADAQQAIEIAAADGPCAASVYERRLVVASDLALTAGRFAQVALEHGLRACCAAPAVADDREVRGVLARYARAPGEPTADNLATILRLADFAGLAITRDRAQKALRESELQLASIIDSAMDGVVTVDADGRIVVFNASAEAMFRCAAEEAIGTSVERFIPPALRDTQHTGLRPFGDSAVGGRSVGRFDSLTGMRADGEKFPLEASLSFVQIDDKPLYTIIVRDLTERRRAEQLRAELEARLRHAQKMEAIGTLAGGIAHDFNNIVAAIVGNVELARHALASGLRADENLDEIRKAGHRARDLVEQMLTFSQRQAPRRASVALADLVNDAAKLVRPLLPPGVVLDVHCEAPSPRVSGDAVQLHRVLLNLATNATHALAGRTGRIEIRVGEAAWRDLPATARAVLEPGTHARLSVHDNGKGMDAATKARVFEPFFTTKPVGEGTGLGLAVVHGIVTAHRGAIVVESAPGRGTRFDIYFPAAVAADPGPPAAAAAPGAVRILYVDDDDSLVFLATRLLRRSGFDVETSGSADEAIGRVRAEPSRFDLLVTDINMPGLSGLDMAREVRALAPDLPVVLTSGYVTDDLRAQAAAIGVQDIVYKQNTVEQLCGVVEAIARRCARPRVGVASD